MTTYHVHKRNPKWAQPLTKRQHLLSELVEFDLLKDVMCFTLLTDDVQKYGFLEHKKQINSGSIVLKELLNNNQES